MVIKALDSDRYSAQNAGSGSGLNECGSATLLVSTAFLVVLPCCGGGGGGGLFQQHPLADDVEDGAEVGLQALRPVHVLDGGLEAAQLAQVVQVVRPGKAL